MKYLLVFISIIFLTRLGLAQCYPDRHNTSWYDGWVSCETAENPNSIRGESHWILYNFGHAYALEKMQIWNTNDPQHLDRGMRNIVVDYSEDGATWNELGAFEIPQGAGTSTYEGVEGLDFSGAKAQYVLITALDNYGSDCYGLSEVRFATNDEKLADETTPVDSENFCVAVNVFPNPFVNDPTVAIQSNCSRELSYEVTDAMGRVLKVNDTSIGELTSNATLGTQEWTPGIYFLNVRNGVNVLRKKLIKM